MAYSLDLTIDQGSDFVAVLPPVTNPNGSVLNLTGYTPSSLMRLSYATVFAVSITATVSNAAAGIITLSLPNMETAGLNSTRWVYDVVITDGGGIITKVFEGIIMVNPAVTSKSNTSLLTPYVPDDWGGVAVVPPWLFLPIISSVIKGLIHFITFLKHLI